MKKFEQILREVPASWSELKLKDFLKLNEVIVDEEDEFQGLFVGVDNAVKVISTLTGVSIEDIEALPMFQMNALAKKIDFISTLPDAGTKSKIKWKKIDEVTYNDFITFQILSKDPITNLPVIIQAFSKDELTEEQVLNLDVETCFNGFFFLLRYAKAYTSNMIIKTAGKYMKQRVKEKLSTLFRRKSEKQIS